jgi:hypothetical protein
MPEAEMDNCGGVVTGTVAVAVAAAAPSPVSDSDPFATSDRPEVPVALTDTVIATLGKEVPGAIGVGVLDSQFSEESPPESWQAHPTGLAAGTKASPVGRVTDSWGSL